ncbi:TetR/AcrR family transcriptional regulator [Variovorax sp. J22R133]|uniref:TetR/AcrR family transcriptional regulator n=1 Tax=Variovorax brevis TaxID=3053503 RepID=UPI00257554C5|nr:TetR/AcrR family transcriptional regulator [Variovorax sp. J22R133]MDM0117850.1 TetR/AcrR family transcriptional regulator [Variovorax sp. J22R133]
MGHSQADKAKNRDRILTEAATQIREEGLESLSVNKLMQSVNLTHGGFYGHFASRSDLVAHALERALVDGEGTARAASNGRPRSFSTMVRGYLSRTHRDSRSSGCAISALISDVGRADDRSRAVMSAHIEDYISALGGALGKDDDAQAMVAVSALIGALTISRVLADQKRSDALLKAVRDHLCAMQDDGPVDGEGPGTRN